MISSLRGIVLSATTDSVVIEVGGVGFFVAVPSDVAHTARVGHELRLHTSLIVREDALSLYGFTDVTELDVFGHLLGVTGVGPKSALGVLSHMSVDQIAGAVAADDDAPFRRVSGIGPKTAKLIVVQLAGKLQPPVATPAATSVPDEIGTQLMAALIGLGWTERVAADAAERSVAEASDTERGSVALLLRRTLAALGPASAGAQGGARG
jgi:Holliday junction DNA helicase RuvA